MPVRNPLAVFCSLTGLHGFGYLDRHGQEHRPWIETAFWVLAVTTSVTLAFIQCGLSFYDFAKDPLFFNVHTLHSDPGLIPFPALALCPRQALNHMHILEEALNQVKTTTAKEKKL